MPRIEVVRAVRAKELDQLARLLEHHAICLNTGPLYSAVNECKRNPPPHPDGTPATGEWHYEFENLPFRINLDSTAKCVPQDLVPTLDVEFSIRLWARPEHWDDNPHKQGILDPFTALEFNVTLRGKRKDGRPIFASWHIDRNMVSETSGPQKFMHPLYHFQYGGNKLWSTHFEHDYGSALILEAPRFAHPPMDAILGVDFVLTNFLPQKEIKSIRDDNEYRNLLECTQARIWRPYAQALHHVWQTVPATEWTDRTLWPQIVAPPRSVSSVPTKRKH